MRRFSIAGMMAVVLVCGVAVAALRDASDTWAGILLLITLLLLGASILGVLQRRGAKQAFWQGFALFGWGYLTLTMGPWCVEHVAPRLPTTHIMDHLYDRLKPPSSQVPEVALIRSILLDAGVSSGTGLSRGVTAPPNGQSLASLRLAVGLGDLEHFVRVGHCLFALLAALTGGLLGRYFHRSNEAT